MLELSLVGGPSDFFSSILSFVRKDSELIAAL